MGEGRAGGTEGTDNKEESSKGELVRADEPDRLASSHAFG